MATKAGNLTSFKSLVESEFTNNVDDEIRLREFSSKVNIFSKTGDLILYWSETEKCIYSTKTKNFNEDDREEQEIQKLVCSVSPAFPVTTIKCSSNGQHALIFGPNNVGVIELPRRWGEEGIFENGKSVIHCRLAMLDESFFMHHLSTKILQVAWYNGSPDNTHVVVLCSDNCLRFYDVSMPEQPIVRLPLFDQTESTRLGSVASITSAVLGRNGVDFDQGEVIHEGDGTDTYPLYLMQENGDVWLVRCKFSHNRFLVNQQGPLTMNPPSQDNYGCDYCSLICLSSNPTIVVMATESGTLHHCLVMESDAEESEDELRLARSAILMESCEALYVYESVQLELTFLNQQSEDEMSKFSNLQLVKDSSKNDSYLVTSNGGLHTVHLPWMSDLESFMTGDLVMQSPVEIESPAEVAYLLCTQPSDESLHISICGCCLLQDSQMEPFVCCLLSNGQFVNLDFIRNIRSIVGGSTDKMANRQEFASPLRSLKGVGGFDVYMAKILSKSATVPLIRTGGGEQTIPADIYYKLLTKTTQILREEYMQKMLQAKGELEKRCKLLRMKKDEQLEELEHLQENSNLILRGEELASKLETAQEKMHFITERICKVLRNIQTSSPVLSTEEAEWSKELKIMKEKLLKMKRFSEVIHTKHENFVLQSIPDKSVQNKSAKTSSLSTAQAIKVRAVLKEQEKAISQLVDDVQDLNLRVS